LNLQLFEELWSAFIESPNTSDERKILFLYISKPWEQLKESKPVYYFIDSALCKEVLLKYFCESKIFKLDYANFEGYKCFESIFLRYNQQIGNLNLDNNKIVLDSSSVEGMHVIWRLVFSANNEEVKALASDLLVDFCVALRRKDSLQTIDYDLASKLLGDWEFATADRIELAKNILKQYIQKYCLVLI